MIYPVSMACYCTLDYKTYRLYNLFSSYDEKQAAHTANLAKQMEATMKQHDFW